MTEPKIARNARIMRLHATGKFTWQSIADRLVVDGFEEISRQAVGQVIKRAKAKR